LVHTELLHTLLGPQLVPFAAAEPFIHTCPPLFPTMFGVHVSMPLQTRPSSHEFGLIVHENLQFDSQPVPAPLLVPKSQSSPNSTMLSPHTAIADKHAPFWHSMFAPHDIAFCVGSATLAHAWFTSHEAIWQGGAAGQSVTGSVHVAEQFDVHASSADLPLLPPQAVTARTRSTSAIRIPIVLRYRGS
jgi:hypothetical protein